MHTPGMLLSLENIERVSSDWEVVDELHSLANKSIVELGCGRGELTRAIAAAGQGSQILALEVDEIQHSLNLQISDLPNVRFEFAGAESIPCADAAADLVFMFKSLHHVPLDLMDRALGEIRRVLKPGGHLHVSEPIFAGDFNEVLRLFHDEEPQRVAAFNAEARAVDSGLFDLVSQTFFLSTTSFSSFEAFESEIIRATHSEHRLSVALHAEVKARFEEHLGPAGAQFLQPTRVDLLAKPE